MDVLDPVGLTTLQAAVREGTFERAAKHLNVTTPTRWTCCARAGWCVP